MGPAAGARVGVIAASPPDHVLTSRCSARYVRAFVCAGAIRAVVLHWLRGLVAHTPCRAQWHAGARTLALCAWTRWRMRPTYTACTGAIGVLPLLPRCSLPPPQRRTARSRSGVSVVSRGDVLRASGSAVMESAAAPTFVTASELSRIKQSTAIRTAEDIKREKAEAAARMEKRQAVSKARKVRATADAGSCVVCSAHVPVCKCQHGA